MTDKTQYCFAEYGKDLLSLDVDYESFDASKRTALRFTPREGTEPEIEMILEHDDLIELQKMVNDALAHHDDTPTRTVYV